MKCHLFALVTALILFTNNLVAQVFSIEGGTGLGLVLENGRSRVNNVFKFSGNYHFTENIHFGVTAETGIVPIPPDMNMPQQANQQLLNTSDFNYDAVLIGAKYHFFQFWNTKVYIALSVGGSDFYRRLNKIRISERNLLVVPEIGLAIDDVNLALRYYTKGSVPALDDAGNLFINGKFSMLMAMASYRIKFGKR